VITAAAAIMIVVFAGFVLEDNRIIKMFGSASRRRCSSTRRSCACCSCRRRWSCSAPRTGGCRSGSTGSCRRSTSRAVIADPLVRAVTLTGSGPAGRAVASTAAAHLKKSVLELGGSDPSIVLADADITTAAATCAQSRLLNSGQSCISAKRFVVVDEVYDDFLDVFRSEFEQRTVGDPHDDGTDVGPQARVDLRDELHDQVVRSCAQGASVLCGGSIPDGPGAFYPPTILTGVEPGMVAGDEELFGPVAAVLRARDQEHAIELANATVYGLGASVYTSDLERGEDIAANRLRAGTCTVNTMVASDPRLPFGGIGESGFGRELSHHGIKEFVNVKTVTVG
jgi:succinate-semialdehyde dehydrogenase/glutarate-semialdehyde dehydrogenase